VLIQADDLHRDIEAGRTPTLLDVRWALGDSQGRERYREGHIPSAVFVDLDAELSGPAGNGAGRHPLPDIGRLEANARRWGIRADSTVVVYDNSGGQAAARAWWLLRWAGVVNVRILDGGLTAWQEKEFELETGEVEAAAGDVQLSAGHLQVLDAAEAAKVATAGVLIDARAVERYRGDVEPVDPVAGHIPGARSLPTAGNLDERGRFRDSDALRERFASVNADGAQPVGVYCGSGVTAAHQVAALTAAGIESALYVGSWSEWVSDPSRPVATGTDA
jgi:thiosulfate/3-mercaptopyruvate sulfurtransferase